MNNASSNFHSYHFGPANYFLFGVVLVVSLFITAAQASTIVKVNPQTLTIEFGEKAQFSIEIMNVANMYGFQLQISYDPTRVRVVDGDPSVAGIQLFPGDMYEVGQGFLVANEVDNEVGKASFAFTLLAPTPPMEGNGTLVVVEVEAIGGGSSAIGLEEVVLASPDGEALPFVANGGEVVIEGAPEVTPALTETSPEPSAMETEELITPTSSPTLLNNGDTPANQFSQYVLLGLILVMILIMLGALFLIFRWGFRRR